VNRKILGLGGRDNLEHRSVYGLFASRSFQEIQRKAKFDVWIEKVKCDIDINLSSRVCNQRLHSERVRLHLQLIITCDDSYCFGG
jgi:hypothetical protein